MSNECRIELCELCTNLVEDGSSIACALLVKYIRGKRVACPHLLDAALRDPLAYCWSPDFAFADRWHHAESLPSLPARSVMPSRRRADPAIIRRLGQRRGFSRLPWMVKPQERKI